MSWWPKVRKTREPSDAPMEQQGPRSTLLPPPPSGFEATPATLRAQPMPTHNDAALAMIDAALTADLALDYDDFLGDDDDDEDDTRPTLRRSRGGVQATPTLPCRFC